MKSYRDTYRKIIQGCAFAVLALLMGSCVNDQGDDVNCSESTLTLNLVVPQTTLTKAVTSEETSAEPYEGVVHSLKIWIFRSGNGTNVSDAPVVYQEFSSLERLTNAQNIVKISMKVPRDLGNCDIYLQGNFESIDASLGADATRQALKTSTFSKQQWNANLATKGLPMSRIIESINLAKYLDENKTPLELSLLRSICKVGFFFSMETNTKSVKIKSITINKGLADKGSVFPTPSTPDYATQNAQNVNIPAGTSYEDVMFPYSDGKVKQPLPFDVLKRNATAIIRGSEETAEDFKQRLVANSTLLEQAYFPEFDTNAICTITYSIDGEERDPYTFNLDKFTGAIRNHEIIINGFFMNGNLYIKPTVLPWDNGSTTEFNLDNILTTFTSDDNNKFIKNSNNTRIAVATTYEKTSTGDYGHYAKFTFRFDSPAVNHWMLQLSNPAFGFKTNLNGEVKDFLDGVGGGETVIFYVVPKNEYDALSSNDYGTKLYLTLPDYPGYGKIHFNKNGDLPNDGGDNKETEVKIEQVASVAAYEAL